MEKVSAIVLSAGKGKRMNSTVSKQYMDINGKPVIYYTLKAFEASNVDEIIIVTAKDDIDYVKTEIVDKYDISKVAYVVPGGKERYDSVVSGLSYVSHTGKVLIHDGARPLITPEHINNIIENVMVHKACIAGMPVKDTIKIINDSGEVVSTPDRRYVWQIQTPQAFDVKLIKMAYDRMRDVKDTDITDDAMVVERYTDENVKIVKTDYENIKITTAEDLSLFKDILDKRNIN